MNIYIAALVVTAIVSLLGYLWLSMVAFKRSVPWGLLVLLFSPITAIVFAVMYWYDARKAFVVYITAFLLWAGSLVVLIGNVGMGNMQELSSRMQSGKLTPAMAYKLVNNRLEHPGSIDMFAETALEPMAKAGGPAGETDATVATTAEPQEKQSQTQLAGVAKPALPVPASEEDLKQQDASAQMPKPESVALVDSKPVQKIAEPTPVKTEQEIPKQETKTTASTAKQDEVKKESEKTTEKKTTKPKENVPLVKIAQPDPLAQKPYIPPPNTTRVRLSRISHYVGRYFIITLKDGGDRRGLLKQVTSTHLMLDRKLYGGNIRYKIRKTQIKSIKMLTRLPDER